MGAITMKVKGQARLNLSESQITITGTSTLHDWEENLTQFICNVHFDINGSELLNIDKATFICNAKSIESENSLMSSKTYEALKADQYPQIKFELKSIEGLTSKDGHFTCIVLGNIIIAGVTKDISFPISGTYLAGKMSVKGWTTLKLSDFKMTPPTALMGTIKVDNTVVVNFSLGFSL